MRIHTDKKAPHIQSLCETLIRAEEKTKGVVCGQPSCSWWYVINERLTYAKWNSCEK